jgi:hypothetical protein
MAAESGVVEDKVRGWEWIQCRKGVIDVKEKAKRTGACDLPKVVLFTFVSLK